MVSGKKYPKQLLEERLQTMSTRSIRRNMQENAKGISSEKCVEMSNQRGHTTAAIAKHVLMCPPSRCIDVMPGYIANLEYIKTAPVCSSCMLQNAALALLVPNTGSLSCKPSRPDLNTVKTKHACIIVATIGVSAAHHVQLLPHPNTRMRKRNRAKLTGPKDMTTVHGLILFAKKSRVKCERCRTRINLYVADLLSGVKTHQ